MDVDKVTGKIFVFAYADISHGDTTDFLLRCPPNAKGNEAPNARTPAGLPPAVQLANDTNGRRSSSEASPAGGCWHRSGRRAAVIEFSDARFQIVAANPPGANAGEFRSVEAERRRICSVEVQRRRILSVGANAANFVEWRPNAGEFVECRAPAANTNELISGRSRRYSRRDRWPARGRCVRQRSKKVSSA
jgi:hypothetical protein